MASETDPQISTFDQARDVVWTLISRDMSVAQDNRSVILTGHMWSERLLEYLIKNKFSNHSQINEFEFQKKRKILFGLGVFNNNLNENLKTLNKIRTEYAHELHPKSWNFRNMNKNFTNYPNDSDIKKFKLTSELLIFSYCTGNMLSELLDIFMNTPTKK